MMSDYEELKPSEEIEITEKTLFEDEVDAHLTRLKNFFLNADSNYPRMIDLDFLTMHEEKKLITW